MVGESLRKKIFFTECPLKIFFYSKKKSLSCNPIVFFIEKFRTKSIQKTTVIKVNKRQVRLNPQRTTKKVKEAEASKKNSFAVFFSFSRQRMEDI